MKFRPESCAARRPLRERLAIDGDRIADFEEGVIVGPGPPNLSVALKAAEDFSAVDERPVIINRDIGEPNALREARVLADARQIQYCRLGLSAWKTSEQPCDY